MDYKNLAVGYKYNNIWLWTRPPSPCSGLGTGLRAHWHTSPSKRRSECSGNQELRLVSRPPTRQELACLIVYTSIVCQYVHTRCLDYTRTYACLSSLSLCLTFIACLSQSVVYLSIFSCINTVTSSFLYILCPEEATTVAKRRREIRFLSPLYIICNSKK